MNEEITVAHRDGTRTEKIAASVQKNIYFSDVTVPVETGDAIERQLPNGKTEVFLVTKAHLWKGHGGIPSYYEVSYTRVNTPPSRSHPSPRTLNVHVADSSQPHININSTDQSINVQQQNTNTQEALQTFQQVRDAIHNGIEGEQVRNTLLEKVDAMEGSRRKGEFGTAYKDFMAAAADHATVLAPVFSALATLL